MNFNSGTPTLLQSFICAFLYYLLLIICFNNFFQKQSISRQNSSVYTNIISLYVSLYCVFYFCNTDFFHYYEVIKEFSKGYQNPAMEAIYPFIAKTVDYNYLLFRFIIWGTAVYLINKSAKRLQLNSGMVIYTLFVIYIGLFAYARASLAMAIVFMGLAMILSKANVFDITIGICIIAISPIFHSSIIIAIIAIILGSTIKLNRMLIILALCLFPALVIITRYSFNYVMNSSGEGMILNKLIFYSVVEQDVQPNMIGKIRNMLEILCFVIPIYFMLKSIYFKNNKTKVNNIQAEKILCNISFFIVLISLLLNFIDLPSDILSYRVRYMAMIPIVMALTGLVQKKVLSFLQYKICLTLGIITISMGLVSSIKNAI